MFRRICIGFLKGMKINAKIVEYVSVKVENEINCYLQYCLDRIDI